jgi:hypothetical protein
MDHQNHAHQYCHNKRNAHAMTPPTSTEPRPHSSAASWQIEHRPPKTTPAPKTTPTLPKPHPHLQNHTHTSKTTPALPKPHLHFQNHTCTSKTTPTAFPKLRPQFQNHTHTTQTTPTFLQLDGCLVDLAYLTAQLLLVLMFQEHLGPADSVTFDLHS